MGEYDSVWVKCPKCGSEIEYQSKAGSCSFKNYRSSSVPENIANDINNCIETCKECNARITLVYEERPRQVRMDVLILGDKDASYD